nr:hypothetical protein [Tanacetum cinerariifolium]
MATTIEQQVALDESLVPSTQRAFQVTADVPEIYMQEFWATAKLHHNSIRFKIDTRKSVLDLEAFREMMHIRSRIPNQPFADFPTEEEILDFLMFLGHSHDIRYLMDVNVNKLYQPWRSFASVINKCLTGKRSGVDSFRLSQAQMLWGFYHRINIDFAYLIWEDFVYQVEHKNQKRSNEMNYPRFTKVIIDYFMTRKPSISRRNRINWHYIDTKKSVLNLEAFREMLHVSPRILNQPFADLPIEEEVLDFLRFLGHSQDIRYLTDVNVNKLYQPWRSFASVINKCLTGKSSGVDSFRLSQAQMLWGLYHRINIDFAYLIWDDFVYQVEHKSQKRNNEINYPRFTKVIIDYFMTRKPSISRRNRIHWHYVRDDALFSTIKVVSRHQATQQYGAILPIELTNNEIRNIKAYQEYYACAMGEAAPKPKASARKKKGDSASSTTTPTPTPITTAENMATTIEQQTAMDESLVPNTQRSSVSSQSAAASTVDTRSSRSTDEGSRLWADQMDRRFGAREMWIQQPIDYNKHALWGVSHWGRKRKQFYGYAVNRESARDALVEVYDADKAILDTYGDSTILKRRREDDDQEGPSAGSNRGSKRQKEGGEHALASTPSEKATRSKGRTTKGTQSQQLSASESAFAEEPVQTTCQMEEPPHPVFETGANDQPIVQTSQLNVDTLTPELLAGPTYKLMRGSCTSLTELEYQLEEVYKATTDQLDWVNPEGQQYPHNLLQPLPLIPDNRGRRVIPFDHFINNDLEYLRGVNRESALDVYSKRRIITVTELQIVEWHDYKHLDWISVRRDDDQIYKFKEGDFKRLRLQDIEDMLLILGIQMQYLPSTIQRKGDKDRAAAII